MSDEYVFHGRSPVDWLEGANNAHRYTVYFADAPSDEQRVQIATMFENLVARGPVASGSAWSWVDRWATFTVGERWRADEVFFYRMEEVFRAMHAIAPLVQVRYSNAIGPATPGLLNAPAQGWQPDPAFEATRKEFVGDAIRAEGARLAANAEAGDIALVPLAEDVPYPKPVPPQTSVQFGVHDVVLTGRNGRIVSAAYGEAGRKFPLSYVEGDQLRVVETPAIYDIRAFAVSDDGTRALVGAKPTEPGLDVLFDVTLATGACRRVWTAPAGKIHAVLWARDRVFVLTDKKLHWIKIDTGEEIASVGAGGMWLRSLRGGGVLTVYHSSNKLFVVGAAADKLKLLAKLQTLGGCTIVEKPDSIQAFILAGERSTAFELVNVDTAYSAFADTTKPKTPKRKF